LGNVLYLHIISCITAKVFYLLTTVPLLLKQIRISETKKFCEQLPASAPFQTIQCTWKGFYTINIQLSDLLFCRISIIIISNYVRFDKLHTVAISVTVNMYYTVS